MANFKSFLTVSSLGCLQVYYLLARAAGLWPSSGRESLCLKRSDGFVNGCANRTLEGAGLLFQVLVPCFSCGPSVNTFYDYFLMIQEYKQKGRDHIDRISELRRTPQNERLIF